MIGHLPGRPRCPACGHGADGFAGPDRRPGPGDGAVCGSCGALSMYAVNAITGHYSLVQLPDAQRAEFAGDDGPETLPCGCVIDGFGESFMMMPCSPDCEFFQYAIAEADRQGMPVRTIVDPEL
jgi:hypothetical protein